jgi:hypothetical protein
MSVFNRQAKKEPSAAELSFDVTQEIDPALAELLRSGATLTSVDLQQVEIDIELPPGRASDRN